MFTTWYKTGPYVNFLCNTIPLFGKSESGRSVQMSTCMSKAFICFQSHEHDYVSDISLLQPVFHSHLFIKYQALVTWYPWRPDCHGDRICPISCGSLLKDLSHGTETDLIRAEKVVPKLCCTWRDGQGFLETPRRLTPSRAQQGQQEVLSSIIDCHLLWISMCNQWRQHQTILTEQSQDGHLVN